MGGRRWLSSFRSVLRTMLDRRRIRFWIVIVVAVMVCLHLHLGYFSTGGAALFLSPEYVAIREAAADAGRDVISPEAWEQRAMERVVLETRPRMDRPHHAIRDSDPWGARGGVMLPNHTVTALDPEFAFDPEGGRDVLVFLHIQKTGGTTFGRHLVSDLELRTSCKCHPERKKCDCRDANDKIWTVNRYSTGWRCGLHADWTELTQCVDKMLDRAEGGHRDRRYLYITILRDPYTRYISEFKHVQRGATWKSARLQCDGRQASLEEVPFCFEGADWAGVSLDGFMRCPHNLANNRQARMLANLTLSGCYKGGLVSAEGRQRTMLQSAKDNLRQMAFFGLTEYQRETQRLFEATFRLRFRRQFFQYNHTHAGEAGVGQRQRRLIQRLNQLDAELYDFAKELFFRRLRHALGAEAPGSGTPGGVRSPARRQDDDHEDDARGRWGWAGSQRGAATSRNDDYEEGDEEDADDDGDDEYNHRIAEKRRRHF